MHARYLAVGAALLALAACDDGESASPVLPKAEGEAKLAVAPVGPRWNVFTSQSPTETLDATPGWEVGTRFTSSKSGKVIGFRFWRADGETGSNYAKLWTDAGSRMATSPAFPSGTGWVEVRLATPVKVAANTVYRVSVNTNVRQVKKPGGYATDGAISNGPLYSDGGYYGQPTGAMPSSSSASMFFIDVIFEEDVPLPNLVVTSIGPSEYSVFIRVCNRGTGSSDSFHTRLSHSYRTKTGGFAGRDADRYVLMPGLAAGECSAANVAVSSPPEYWHDYTVYADSENRVYESVENDNVGFASR
jgi:hypothetical protein